MVLGDRLERPVEDVTTFLSVRDVGGSNRNRHKISPCPTSPFVRGSATACKRDLNDPRPKAGRSGPAREHQCPGEKTYSKATAGCFTGLSSRSCSTALRGSLWRHERSTQRLISSQEEFNALAVGAKGFSAIEPVHCCIEGLVCFAQIRRHGVGVIQGVTP
jgi:hypothetical protein